MSIESLTQEVTVTIKRRSQTRTSTGGKGAINYTTAARGTRPTSTTCRAMTKRASENEKYGVRGDTLLWKFLFSTDPQVTTADLIEFTDNNSATRQVRCLHRGEDLDMQGRLFRVHGEEISNED